MFHPYCKECNERLVCSRHDTLFHAVQQDFSGKPSKVTKPTAEEVKRVDRITKK